MRNSRIPVGFNLDFKKNMKANANELVEIANIVDEHANQNNDIVVNVVTDQNEKIDQNEGANDDINEFFDYQPKKTGVKFKVNHDDNLNENANQEDDLDGDTNQEDLFKYYDSDNDQTDM